MSGRGRSRQQGSSRTEDWVQTAEQNGEADWLWLAGDEIKRTLKDQMKFAFKPQEGNVGSGASERGESREIANRRVAKSITLRGLRGRPEVDHWC